MLGIAASTGKRIVQSVWDTIQPDWRPTSLTPLGCGHYGCVYPTADPSIVLKVTTDPSEVTFVQAALATHGPDGFPEGIVRYYRIDATSQLYRGRPAYLIWRESAFDVGLVINALESDPDTYLQRTAREAYKYQSMYQGYAALVREALRRSDNPIELQTEAARYANWAWTNVNWDDGVARVKNFRGGQRFAAAERAALGTAQLLGSTYLFDAIGEALEFYQNRGLLMADVHPGNIGHVTRPDFKNPVIAITDPGHAVDILPYLQAAGRL